MPLSLAELKGLAVARMNAEPVIPLKTGHVLPRNFVIDTEHRWGFSALRFSETVHLLSIPALPAGIDDALTGQQVFAVTHHLGADPLRRCLLRQPINPISLVGLFADPREAVETAASTRSGQEFLRMALAGEFKAAVEKETPPPRPRPLRAELGDFDRSLYECRDSVPPDSARVDALIAVFRALHGDNADNERYLAKLAVQSGPSFLGIPALLVGDHFQVFSLPHVPGAAFDEDGEQPDRNLEYPAVVVAKLNRRRRELALGKAFPELPISRAALMGVRLTWGEAIMKAALEWLLDQRHRELQEKLGYATE